MKVLSPLLPALILASSLFSVMGVRDLPDHSVNMRLRLRTQIQPFPGSADWADAYFDESVPASRTAIIITDMWDKHWCRGATERVGQIAQRMEPVLERARTAGILIIHAPSETMPYYANTPGRLLAQNAPKVAPPPERSLLQPPLPIDDSDQGCDTPNDTVHRAWTKENAALTIAPGDVISDQGSEIYNVLREHHIDTVLFMGVHANMCILNRTFGMRQLTKWGLRCILVRNLTDAMYNPASRPYVSHAEGVDLVVRYIEKYVGPSIASTDLLASFSRSGGK